MIGSETIEVAFHDAGVEEEAVVALCKRWDAEGVLRLSSGCFSSDWSEATIGGGDSGTKGRSLVTMGT